MARKAELNNKLSRNSSQREIRPIWNNVQRINKQNQFVPEAVLTRTGKIPVNTARASSTKNVSTARQSFNRQTVLTSTAMKVNTVKPIVNRVRPANVFHKTHSPISSPFKKTTVLRTDFPKQKVNTAKDYPHRALKNKGIVDSGCSRHMTRTLLNSKTLMVALLLLEHFNLFSVSQMCDKKNKVLFTDSECLVLSPEFKLPDENQVLLKIPRQNNMYSFNLENIVPSGGLACLIAKATTDESNKWHRRLGHVNFKNLNKLVKGNLVRGLPSKIFQNDHTCVACQKGKQHKASCKAKSVSSISHSLQLLHMDLFGPTSVRSLNHKTYCLVITDDFSRFSWVFFLRTKDETSGILKDFIRQIENQLNQKVKTIRCDNGTEFKNKDVIEFCGSKGIKREYSNARTPQQNGVAERKNRTLIEAARTMLADSFLPNTFWAEAVSTACYVLNRVLVTKPHNKTPYELLTGKLFSGTSHTLFATMLVQHNSRSSVLPSERPSEAQHYTLSCSHLVKLPQEPQTVSFLLKQVRDTIEELVIIPVINPFSSGNEGDMSSLQEVSYDLCLYSVRAQDPLFDEIPEDTVDHMETENAQDEGRTREMVDEDKEIDENILITDGSKVSTDRQIEGTKEQNKGTKEKNEGTEEHIEGTEEHIEGTEEQNKGIEEKNEGTEEHIEGTEEHIELESDEEMARKIQEEWEGEEERNKIAKEKAANEALIRNFDDIKARIEADRLLAEKLQEQEREQFTIEERAKFLQDTIVAQRKFLAQQRSEAIMNRTQTKNQLRNQMMTYLKHVGNFKHAELKIKKFEEVQALYEKIKRSDEDFISIGSAEDERLIKRMNEKGVDLSKSEVIKEESKEEESTRKRKLGTRKKMKSRKRRYIQNTSEDDSDKENDELRLHLTIAPDEEKEVDYEILDRKYPIKEWKTECLGTKPQTNQAEHFEEINQNVVIRSNGQKRYFSTLMRVLSIFDREDLNVVYQLVMDRFQDEIPEGFDRVLWGDLMVMFNPDDENEFWNSQLE
ncbi:putative ribonuclease H-like domain-containing protein [Tanacetum coccineum]